MHVHISALDAVIVFGYVVIMGMLWRLAAAHLAQKDGNWRTIGSAMAVIY